MSNVLINRSISTLGARTEWLLWFVGMTGCTAFVAFRYMQSGLPATGVDAMVLLISGLFVVVVIKSFNDVSFLDRETKLATRQINQLVETNDIARFLDVANESVFRSHMAALHTIFLSDSRIEQGNLIEIVHARLSARNRVVELLSSILITLGLIGTIIGLLMSVGGLSDVLGGDGSDFEQVRLAMQKTVSGLGTAFYTTLFGAVSGGVILRVLTSVVDAHILRYIAHLSELIEVHVLPAMRRTAVRLAESGFYEGEEPGSGQNHTAMWTKR